MGKLITFEGIDGSGKTTQIKLLENWFSKSNISYLTFREPGGTKLSEKVRDILLDNENLLLSNQAESLLFVAARAQLVDEKIKPALKQDFNVICDRYIDSTVAYQGYGRGLNIDYLEEIRSSKDPQENSPGLLLKIETLDKSVSNILLYARDINPVLITFNGGRVFVSLRRKQFVLPVVLTLEDFQAEFHPNSETPTSFESNVTIETSEFSRNALISMNNPLRFAGYTFYQASYAIDATGRETSTFAVVENRSRLVPYIGTAVIGIGLVIHFLQTLTHRKRQSVTRNDD